MAGTSMFQSKKDPLEEGAGLPPTPSHSSATFALAPSGPPGNAQHGPAEGLNLHPAQMSDLRADELQPCTIPSRRAGHQRPRKIQRTFKDLSLDDTDDRPLRETSGHAGRGRQNWEGRATKHKTNLMESEVVPTEIYLQQSLVQSSRLTAIKPLLVILDLNRALIYRASRGEPQTCQHRPFLAEFISYCLAEHYVLVWSSAQPENVRKIVQSFFPETALDQLRQLSPGRRLLGIWGRDMLGLSPAQYHHKVQVYKRLETVWNSESISHCEGDSGLTPVDRWNQSNTVLIDDSHVKASSQPHNLIQVPEFVGQKEPYEKPVLEQVMAYLINLSLQSDVSAYMRLDPFRSA